MSAPIPCTDCTSIFRFPDIRFGTDADPLENIFKEMIEGFKNTKTLGKINEALNALNEVFKECHEEGWDGYDARPITKEVYSEAMRLIEYLPLTSSFPMPEIVPEPTGEIGLEWHKGNRQVFVASVSGKNEIVYAGLFGTNKTHGTEYFGESPPSVIIDNLKRLYF